MSLLPDCSYPEALTNPHLLQPWSEYLTRELARVPSLAERDYQQAWQPGQVKDYCLERLSQVATDAELVKVLRELRREIMVSIAVRDLAGAASLTESLRSLSELADGLVGGALAYWEPVFEQKFGQPMGRDSGMPQKMVIIGMGKLGGHELNFSSDIDLIFVFPEAGSTNGTRQISNDQFFSKLGQALNKSLTEMTEDGIVYRVDMRLRPFGDAGPLAISFAGMEHYYEAHGRAWERYALVKARAIAGPEDTAEELFDILRPFVYRRYVDYTAMDSLRDLKRMIMAEVRKKGMESNVKLGRGGIREIEFIVQAFQLVHGGRDLHLQGRQLLPTLQYLAAQDYIAPQDADDLAKAYTFLRFTENRLQAWNDQQTHDLPESPHQQLMLAQAMGFVDYAAFLDVLNGHRNLVQQHFDDVFADEADVCDLTDALAQAWKGPLEDDALIILTQFGFRHPGDILNLLRQFKKTRALSHMSGEATTRLEQVMPLILKALSEREQQEVALQRVLAVIEAVVRRSVYLVLLKENPQALAHLLILCEVSPWLTEMLVKYPALMDQLLDLRSLYRPLTLDELLMEATELHRLYSDDEEAFMLQLRHWRHAQVFKVAAADVTGQLPVMKVSDYLTWIAQAILQVSHDYAWQHLTAKHGLPAGCEASPLMIIGYGKLGGIELGYGSDLDIVFLYHGIEATGRTNGARSLEHGPFMTRLCQKIISVLTTMMPAGQLYEVDTRLRPNGASGMMVSSLDSFAQYQRDKAWNWEHQALIRARALVGQTQNCAAFERFRQTFLTQARESQLVRDEVVAMRKKMREALDKSDAHWLDLKHGVGAIVDIEFMVQYWVLAYASRYPSLVEYSDNMRILDALKTVDLLPDTQVQALQDHYRRYRSAYHRLALQKDGSMVERKPYQQACDEVSAIWQRVMEA
ncbi:bifunctional [glutamate--ammonia ligase]-adenylyl-L-tyrosine phosphorylase/[glutamate--ammonia-ligase] adenylyltransferase [Thiomicrospira sp. ALE5]|uniref:bifunctional [glutamate--ammonia ligase]-adenylyl-L-tyrosine phosphorylase/[glutamate--ammonia-ligase] adenylyltransferase n=1 Tax=Thiomicrospira sp. ALE5 TaxID=748650 RepID=UPI0008EE7271|nr:bifunctional [glutamate--ammonia ligase]-adenylyl-L-tyrosine phosphorylase/[glutamate--ammonia-ligase] adenylyltransferase [Thiomicrospira sp. ALE5]SFR55634.1 glutamate-ammonia-ligase adenylyltransferase [Thiomicrospira sp. ALE5]